jgi:hypothetical protein
MRATLLVLGVLLLGAFPAAVRGQSAGNGGDRPDDERNAEATAPAVHVDSLVNVERVRRALAQRPTERETFDGRQVRTYLEIYGTAPPIEVLQPQDFSPGAVRYGGMTHQEFLNVVTPQEFRAPVMNLSNAASELANWWKKRADERRRKEEARRRGEGSTVVVDPPK